jgi:hypothetical protein
MESLSFVAFERRKFLNGECLCHQLSPRLVTHNEDDVDRDHEATKN